MAGFLRDQIKELVGGKTQIEEDSGANFSLEYHFSNGQDIEIDGEKHSLNFNRMFNNRVEVTYKGNGVFLEPLENILVYKTEIGRKKDIRDLKLLLKKEDQIDRSFLRETLKDKENRREILKQLRNLGYDIE